MTFKRENKNSNYHYFLQDGQIDLNLIFKSERPLLFTWSHKNYCEFNLRECRSAIAKETRVRVQGVKSLGGHFAWGLIFMK